MKILELDYISKFVCDGANCADNCCKRDAVIAIDDATFSKYKHIKPAAKSKEITEHIKKKKHLIRGEINQLMLNEAHQCPFLDDDNLCGIQKTYGEDYLSISCKTYPRLGFRVSKDVLYRALSLTCPAACRLMLNAPRNSDFSSYESSEPKNMGRIDLTRVNRSFMLPLLNVTNYSILRYQDLTLDERLAMVALFAESANNAKTVSDLNGISEAFVRSVLKNAREVLDNMTFNYAGFLRETLAFIKALFNEEGKTSQDYVKFINDVFEISVLEDDINALDFDKIEKNYEEKYLPAKTKLFEINDLQLENFAINYLFMTAFPISREVKDFNKNIAEFLAKYKIAEFIFVCFYASTKETWQENAMESAATDIVGCFSRNVSLKYAINEKFKDMGSVSVAIQLLLDV